MIWLMLISLGVSSLVAFFIALGFYFIAPNIAYAVFWITMGLEIVIMEPINRILARKRIEEEGKTFDKLTKLEKAVGKQTVALNCEYCGEENHVKIDIGNAEPFICHKCGNSNKIIIQFSTIRTTNPVDTINASEVEVIDEMQDLEMELGNDR